MPSPGLEPSWQPAGLLRVYRGVASLFGPLIGLSLRAFKTENGRAGERAGTATAARPGGRVVWVHAASVGEMNAIRLVIERLTDYQWHIVLTTNTQTAARLADAAKLINVIHQYAPLDVPAYAARFVDHWQPEIALFAESEIWPNHLIELSKRNIPVTIVNGRISHRSAGRWQRIPKTARDLFQRFDLITAQSEGDARRFGELGAEPVIATGNLKFDRPALPVDQEKLSRLQQWIGARPVWLVASSHAGEEQIALRASGALPADIGDPLLILVPRYPDRGADLKELCVRQNISVAMRSLDEAITPETDVYVADTLGELGLFYALSPVAFVGGSLVPRGGQNPIEAIQLDCAVVHGPLVENVRELYRDLDAVGGAIAVEDADGLAAAVGDLLADPDRRALQCRTAHSRILQDAGAFERTWTALCGRFPILERSHIDGSR